MEGKRTASRRAKKGKSKSEPASNVFGQESRRLFRMFGHQHDPAKIETRIKELKEISTNDTKESFKSYGLVHYRSLNCPKLVGVLHNREDVRLDEVTLAGERAMPTSYEVPVHPLRLKPVEELDIVKDGLISVEDVQEILDCVQADDFGKSIWTIALTCPGLDRDITKEERKVLRETLQLLVGFNAEVFYKKDELCVQKYVKNSLHPRTVLPWLWPGYLRFVASGVQHPKNFQRFLNRTDLKTLPNFAWSHVEPRTSHSHIFVQMRNVEPDLVANSFGCRVANFSFTEEKIVNGGYKGNMFRFAIRSIKKCQEKLMTLMKDFEENGYINYYNVTTPYSAIIEPGKLFTLGKFQEAIEAMLRPFAQPQKYQLEEVKALYFVFQDAQPLAESIKRCRVGEEPFAPAELILQGIADTGKLDKKSTTSILKHTGLAPTFTETANTFLNFIWNQTVNKVIEKRGLKLAVGDLVFVDEAAERRVLYERQSGACIAKRYFRKEREICKDTKTVVRALTQEDIDSDKYTIFDLLIPVCGVEVTWPENEIGTYVDELLKEHGIEKGREHFSSIPNKDYPFVYHGTYRKVLCRTEQLTWYTKEYDKMTEPLIFDDLPVVKTRAVENQLKHEEKTKDYNGKNKKKEEEKVEKKPEEETTKEKDMKMALIVELFLPKTTHLSAPLRELFKKNELGSAMIPFGEFRKVHSDMIENIVDGLNEYVKNIPTVKEKHERETGLRAENIEAVKRIDILERELALMRKERELVELRREIIGDVRGSRERRVRDESPRRRRSRSRDRYRSRFDRSPDRRSGSRYSSHRRSDSRDRGRHSTRDRDARLNAARSPVARDRRPSPRTTSPRDRMRFDPRDDFRGSSNFGLDSRGPFNPEPLGRFNADSRGNFTPDMRGPLNVGRFNAESRGNFGPDLRGPSNVEPFGQFNQGLNRPFNAETRGQFSTPDPRDRFINADPRFGRSLIGPPSMLQRDDGVKRMRLDLNHSTDDNLYNPFDDFKGGARNIGDARPIGPYGQWR